MPAAAVALGLALLAYYPGIRAAYTVPKLVVLSLGALLCLLPGRRGTSLDRPLLLLWGALLASTLVSVDPWTSVVGRYNDFAHGLWGAGLATCFYLLGTRTREDDPLGYLLIALCLVAGVTLGQRLAEVDLRTGMRALGPSGDPIGTGLVLAMLTPLALWQKRYEMLPLFFAAIWATGSRGAFAGAAAGLLAYAVLRRRSFDLG